MRKMWKEHIGRRWNWLCCLQSHIIYKSITLPKLGFFLMIWVCSVLLLSSPENLLFWFATYNQSGGQREVTVAAVKSLLCRSGDPTDGHAYNILANHTRG
jgi:hypothetical protein